MNVLVTGGAGLVGSYFCEKLLALGLRVVCVDNLVLGTKRHIEPYLSNPNFTFETWDVSRLGWHKPLIGKKFDLCIHLAANSDISIGFDHPETDFNRTVDTSFATLCAVRELKIPDFIFSSTSAVYGENPIFPTPESTSKLHPVSVYGAGKLASEAFISAFTNNYGINSWIFRFGNVVGERLTHGVIFDFIKKLRWDPSRLSVLGDGSQSKTYIDVTDCIDGMWFAYQKSKPKTKRHEDRFQIFNLSTNGMTSVHEIANKSVEVITGGKAKIEFGTSKIGWVGDVPKTSLDIDKITKLGWKPKKTSSHAVYDAITDFYKWSN